MLRKTVFFIVLLFASNLALGDSSNMTLESLADICEAMEKTILDVTVKYEFSIDPPPKSKAGVTVGTGPQKYTWSAATPFTELSKSSCDFSVMNEYGDTWDVHISQAYDGKIAKKYQLDGWPKRSSEGIITNKRNFKPIKSLTPLAYTVHHFVDQYFTLSQLLREKEKVTIALDNNIVKVNNFNAICVSVYGHSGDKKILAQRVFFSTEHNFTPIKIEYFNGRVSAGSFDVLELEEVKEGIWFPVEGCSISSDPNTPKNIYKASKVLLNQRLKKDFFDIEFPTGTEVHDEITGLRYIIKPTEEQFDKWLKEEDVISRIESKKINTVNSINLKNKSCTVNQNPSSCIEPNEVQSSANKVELLQISSNPPIWRKIIWAVFLLAIAGLGVTFLKKNIKKR